MCSYAHAIQTQGRIAKSSLPAFVLDPNACAVVEKEGLRKVRGRLSEDTGQRVNSASLLSPFWDLPARCLTQYLMALALSKRRLHVVREYERCQTLVPICSGQSLIYPTGSEYKQRPQNVNICRFQHQHDWTDSSILALKQSTNMSLHFIHERKDVCVGNKEIPTYDLIYSYSPGLIACNLIWILSWTVNIIKTV